MGYLVPPFRSIQKGIFYITNQQKFFIIGYSITKLKVMDINYIKEDRSLSTIVFFSQQKIKQSIHKLRL